jgi:tetratricopeptide (TPR) repeat protein
MTLPRRLPTRLSAALALALLFAGGISAPSASGSSRQAETAFQQATNAFHLGDYPQAARLFRQANNLQLGSGTLQNLGSAEWEKGEAGLAVLAWEQALWVDSFNRGARQNLAYARRAAQLQEPELSWHEKVSTWLPVNYWAWITGGSLWLALSMVVLPGVFRRRRSSWHQATAAAALTIFLLGLPAHIGVQTRTNLGFILHGETPLRLTPTAEAQVIARLQAGEPARQERTRGDYTLVKTGSARGWVETSQLGLICPKQGEVSAN